jgi:hypothetical protein
MKLESFPFKNSNEFSLHIEKMAIAYKISHMDAVLKYCEDNLLEPKDIASKVNKSLKEKIATNMRDLNYLPKQASLDV